MVNKYAPRMRLDGSISDSTMDNSPNIGPGRVATSLLRGVVVQVNYLRQHGVQSHTGIYCDVFIYSTATPANGPLYNVLVTYPYSGLQEGDIMLPRPCTRQMQEIAVGIRESTLTPSALDGDHVLVGFIDGELSLPTIVSYLPHPSADVGKTSTDPIGYRIVPTEDDLKDGGKIVGSPAFRKHQGIYTGVDVTGNYLTDTTKAHQTPRGAGTAAAGGGYTAEGEEVSSEVPGAATSGNYTIKLKENAKLLIEFESGNNSVEVVDSDGEITITAGTSVTINADTATVNADSVTVGNNAVEAAVLGNKLVTQIEALTVGTAFGPSSTPVNAALFSAGATSCLSTSVKIKD